MIIYFECEWKSNYRDKELLKDKYIEKKETSGGKSAARNPQETAN